MKRVGFPGTKAGAIEVAASTNGQLTPPIMGAAAFLMVEYVGISYLEVIKSAILPAAISYIALFYIVHLEAVKAGMEGLPRRNNPGLLRSMLSFSGTILGLCVLSLAVYYSIGWTKTVFGDAATWIVASGVLFAYLGLTWLASRSPENHFEQNETEVLEMPPVGPTDTERPALPLTHCRIDMVYCSRAFLSRIIGILGDCLFDWHCRYATPSDYVLPENRLCISSLVRRYH